VHNRRMRVRMSQEVSGMFTDSEKLDVVIDTLEALSGLHDPRPYLGVNYCHCCSKEWPCDTAEVLVFFKEGLSIRG